MKFFDFFKREKKAPETGAKVRRFNAAKIDRFTASWFASTQSINQELQGDLDNLRKRGRDLSKNNEYGKKFQNMVISNVVGPNGFNLQARTTNQNGKPDKNNNEALERAFSAWSARGVCDVTGKLSFTALNRILLSGMPSDGEFLVKFVRGKAAGNDFGFALQCIDISRLDTQLNREATSTLNAIVMGVEINKYQRPLYYHILTAESALIGNNKHERISADDIYHGYIAETAEQIRGIPWMAPSILSLHHLSKFEESALLAARHGADNLGFFYTEDGEPPGIGDGVSGGEDGTGGDEFKISVPGSYDVLPDGVKYQQHDSKYPDTMIEGFIKNFLRRVSSGFNVAYNGFANDLEGVNFSSIRAGVIEERDQWMTLQNWHSDFLARVYQEWLRMALLNSAIVSSNGTPLPASKLTKFKPHHWQARRWQWVDPAKDIKAARDSVKSGVLSPQMIAAQQGVSIDSVLEDIERFEELTSNSNIINYDEGAKPAAASTEKPTDENTEGESS